MVVRRWRGGWSVLAVLAVLAACGDSGSFAPRTDASTPAMADAAVLDTSADTLRDSEDAASDAPADAKPFDAADASLPFATYRIEIGAHAATVQGGSPSNPLAGLSTTSGRDFDFAFNPSARYVLVNPVQPQDQLDWNKLPGFSDCGQLDLAQFGAMFGWRWRLDRNPKVLEVTAYANIQGAHSAKMPPLLELSDAELSLDGPLRYGVSIDGATYRFSIKGSLGTRTIDVATTLTRGCSGTAPSAFKWTSGMYFGGTSTAPSVITARVFERPF